MKRNRWYALPLAGLAAIVIGVVAVEAAPSPSPSASGSSSYGQVFLDKLANILHLNRQQTQDALKQAQLQTVDQMLKDGKVNQAQANAMKAKINAGQGLGAVGGFGFRQGKPGNRANRTLMRDLATAELNAAAAALKMKPADLTSALRSGKSLSDLEGQQQVSDSAVKSAMKAAAKTVLDKAVQAKTITQGQEDAMLARVGSLGARKLPTPRVPAAPGATPAAYYQTF